MAGRKDLLGAVVTCDVFRENMNALLDSELSQSDREKNAGACETLPGMRALV